jgi:acyl-CoA thioesterase-2
MLRMQRVLQDLIALLDLEPIEVNLFRGRSPKDGWQRVFGGQVAGQALVAAGRTVDPARSVHSLHGYFVRAGDPAEPIEYTVENIRDGRSFSVRRCIARQHGKAIFTMESSFQRQESGLDHQPPPPVGVPGPEETPTMQELLAPYPERQLVWANVPRPLDVRYVTVPGWVRAGERPTSDHQQVWMRIAGRLPDDPLLHACVVAYASDLTLLDTAVMQHQINYEDDNFMIASLDHAMWFHRPFRADEWLLYDQDSPSASGARGTARGSIFTHDGHLAVTVVQEGLIRQAR